jgi:hypothetical protein
MDGLNRATRSVAAQPFRIDVRLDLDDLPAVVGEVTARRERDRLVARRRGRIDRKRVDLGHGGDGYGETEENEGRKQRGASHLTPPEGSGGSRFRSP